jgi:hypothetical protein
MMSKERELLQRCLDEFEYKGVACNELCIDINKLLAKPEQEPVAWMYDHQIEVGYDKYTEVNIIETCARNLESNNCINIRPLYLAPPKREPLSDAQIAELWGDKHSGKTYKVKNFARAIEKEHGIGGGNE